ncbi:MAG: N-acetyltransferase [Pseudomonadota bacterium]
MFIQSPAKVPDQLQTDEFIIRPIEVNDAEADYEAVMESREFLRLWEQSSWPEDDFTLEENRKDVEKLVERHASGHSFAFTVLTPDETRCLGCIYVFPNDAGMFVRSEISPRDSNAWVDVSAANYFWVRKSELKSGLDQRLLRHLADWFKSKWKFKQPVFVTNQQYDQQVTMFEQAQLSLQFEINDPNAEGKFLAYGIRSPSPV